MRLRRSLTWIGALAGLMAFGGVASAQIPPLPPGALELGVDASGVPAGGPVGIGCELNVLVPGFIVDDAACGPVLVLAETPDDEVTVGATLSRPGGLLEARCETTFVFPEPSYQGADCGVAVKADAAERIAGGGPAVVAPSEPAPHTDTQATTVEERKRPRQRWQERVEERRDERRQRYEQRRARWRGDDTTQASEG